MRIAQVATLYESVPPKAYGGIERVVSWLTEAMLERVVRMSPTFDIVHFHTDYQSFPFARRLACPHLTTLHWRLDIQGLESLYREFRLSCPGVKLKGNAISASAKRSSR